jgi:hypothetical protein
MVIGEVIERADATPDGAGFVILRMLAGPPILPQAPLARAILCDTQPAGSPQQFTKPLTDEYRAFPPVPPVASLRGASAR